MPRARRALVVTALVACAVPFRAEATRSLAPVPATGALAYEHLTTYAGMGIHRTGTDVDAATAKWIARKLAAAGHEVRTQRFEFPQFTARDVALEVGGARPAVIPIYYSGTTGSGGVTAPLVDVGLGTPLEFSRNDVRGRIALVQVPQPAPGAHPTLEGTLARAADNGAAAVVMAIGAADNQLFGVNSDSRAGLCQLPALVVGRDDGAALRAHAGKLATVVLDATMARGATRNVVGILRGRTDRTIIVGTPMNGWFHAATERGTGIGTFLTLARHFATTTPEHTLVFVATAGHEVGFLGLERFLADNPGLVERAIGYVHLGASLAARHDTEVAGEIVSTDAPAPFRVLIVSENPLLQAVATESFLPAQPIAQVPPSAGQSGEQQFAYEAGIPMVSISGTFLWFHTPRDLPDTTTPALLDPVVQGFRTVVERLLAADPEQVDAANAPARLVDEVASAGLGNTVAAC